MAKRRAKTVKLEWQDVDSSNVQQVSYHEQSQTVCVRFHNGGLYSYSGPDMEVYTSLVHAPSVGKYLNNAIKGVYPYTKWYSEGELLEYLRTK